MEDVPVGRPGRRLIYVKKRSSDFSPRAPVRKDVLNGCPSCGKRQIGVTITQIAENPGDKGIAVYYCSCGYERKVAFLLPPPTREEREAGEQRLKLRRLRRKDRRAARRERKRAQREESGEPVRRRSSVTVIVRRRSDA